MVSRSDNYPGVNVMLMGPSGTGKTHALHTLCGLGLEVFVLFTEPGLETLIGAWSDKGQSVPPELHWHYLPPKMQGFKTLQNTADLIGKFSLEALSKMQDTERAKNNRVYELFGLLNNFVDQRTGQSFGAVDTWDTNRVLVIDGLSETNQMFLEMVVGTKPVRSQSDWGIAQNNLMAWLRQCTNGCKCHFVLIAHVERETDLILGGVKLMPSTLGKAITGQIPTLFSDVLLSVRDGKDFFWDAASALADVKSRNLPMEGRLRPNFGPIIEKWRSRRAAAGG